MNNNKFPETKRSSKVAGYRNVTWLPITLVAELSEIKPQSIREAIKERGGKYKDGRYVFRKFNGNGGARYEILLTSLPETIQAKYWLEHHQYTDSSLPEAVPEQENYFLNHDDYNATWCAYGRKSSSIKEQAQERVVILDGYLKLLSGGLKKRCGIKYS